MKKIILSYRNFNLESIKGLKFRPPFALQVKGRDQIGKFRYDPAPLIKGAARREIVHERKRVPIWFKTVVMIAVVFIFNQFVNAQEGTMKVTSSAFDHNAMIPKKYTCQGEDISPPLAISDIPEGTVTLALINDDPDAPMGTWDHWIIWNIKPAEDIAENSTPGKQGKNSWGRNDYGGPCPPSGTHRYFFKLYALDFELELKEGATKAELETDMHGHILEQAELIGLYKKS